jgi:hypothetical protein
VLLGIGLALLAGFSTLLAKFQTESKKVVPDQTAGGVQAGEPKFRLIRSLAGTKGQDQGGKFIMEDPRTVFYIPADQKVIVYFEWEGPPGVHHLEGRWKNPEGKVAVLSDFEYEAGQRRFGAFWSLTLAEQVPSGLWALETHVDGELAGTHTFQIVAAPRPAVEEKARRPLSAAELYKLALRATVTLQRLNSTGELLGVGSGFVTKDGLVLSSFDAIDGAKALQVVLTDGDHKSVDGILKWNRREDWVVLRVPGLDTDGLPLAQSDSWAVGDQYFTLDTPADGSRTIVDGTITGTHNFPDFGQRLHLSFSTTQKASGSPVLNDYGEVIGVIVHGSLLPGSQFLGITRGAYPGNLVATGSPYRLDTVLAVPINAIQIPTDGRPARSLDELERAGQLISPLQLNRNIWRGTVARKVERQGAMAEPVDEKFEYPRRDGQVAVLVSWQAKEKIKSQYSFRLYDIDNRLVSEGKPAKLNLDTGRNVDTWWQLDISKLPAGLYRLDIILGSNPAWRTFFRIIE